MRTITKITKITVYNYDELSTEAKKNVEILYLNSLNPIGFKGIWEEGLEACFPHSDLNLQFSFNYDKEDGVNIYGRIFYKDLITFFRDSFTEKEMSIIEQAIQKSNINSCIMEKNIYGNYCVMHWNNFICDIVDELYPEDNAPEDVLNILFKFNNRIKNYFHTLCDNIKTAGYKYFYEVNEEKIKNWIDANKYEFLENGDIY